MAEVAAGAYKDLHQYIYSYGIYVCICVHKYNDLCVNMHIHALFKKQKRKSTKEVYMPMYFFCVVGEGERGGKWGGAKIDIKLKIAKGC